MSMLIFLLLLVDLSLVVYYIQIFIHFFLLLRFVFNSLVLVLIYRIRFFLCLQSLLVAVIVGFILLCQIFWKLFTTLLALFIMLFFCWNILLNYLFTWLIYDVYINIFQLCGVPVILYCFLFPDPMMPLICNCRIILSL